MKKQKEIKNNLSKPKTMKTLKLFIAAIIFVGFANAVSAQTNPQATLNASATVFVELEIEETQALNFGNIQQNSTAIVGTDGNHSEAGLLSSEATRGEITVTGNNNASISLSSLSGFGNITLNHTDGSSLTVTPEWEWNNDETLDATADNLSLDENGSGILLVGGSIVVGADATQGLYQGDITITVDYDSL